MPRKRRGISREFKLAALARFETAEDVSLLAAELGIRRELLYKWHRKFAAGGEAGLRGSGRPRAVDLVAEGEPRETADARQRIAELEREIGRQKLELDFFRAALRQVRERRRPSGRRGDPESTR